MRPDRIVKACVRQRFLITMKSNSTWDGVLYEADQNTLVLRDPSSVHPDGTRLKADSDILLPRADVAYMQRLN